MDARMIAANYSERPRKDRMMVRRRYIRWALYAVDYSVSANTIKLTIPSERSTTSHNSKKVFIVVIRVAVASRSRRLGLTERTRRPVDQVPGVQCMLMKPGTVNTSTSRHDGRRIRKFRDRHSIDHRDGQLRHGSARQLSGVVMAAHKTHFHRHCTGDNVDDRRNCLNYWSYLLHVLSASISLAAFAQ